MSYGSVELESGVQIAWNVVAAAFYVGAVAMLWRGSRRGRAVSGWRWALALVCGFALHGFAVPLGAVVVVAVGVLEAREHESAPAS